MTSPGANDSTQQTEAKGSALPEVVGGRYRVKKLLGRGGFGAVYEATDDIEERSVALKVIRQDGGSDSRNTRTGMLRPSTRSEAGPGTSRFGGSGRRTVTRSFSATPASHGDDVAEAFRDEFRVLTQLHHPNLAEVYDFGRSPELEGLYFTQELVDGQTLAEYFKNATRETIVEVFVQLARALDYIHALGLIHGDIKPSNVLVIPGKGPGDQPQAKLIDFGLARMLRGSDLETADEESRQITVLGTPGFSAPEKVRGHASDSRSDIYSLAATIYAAARGQRPFPAKDFKEALRAQKDWRPELAGSLLPKCGPVVAELVGRMLQPDPEVRPQSARSIVLELIRREGNLVRDRQQTVHDRREFARVLVEHLPFVDRAHYLELLLDKASDVLRPSSDDPGQSRPGFRTSLIRTVVVETPEGMGKQRLMAELRREIQLGDGLFIETSAWNPGQNVLGPFASVVLQLVSALSDRSPAARKYSDVVKVARGRSDEETAASRLVEFLLACAAEHPFVLCFSDLARGGETSRSTFEALCRAIDHNEAPILFCATTEPHTKLSPILQSLSRDQVGEVWHLRPFTDTEMAAVLEGILGRSAVVEDLVSMMDKLTGGHPLSFRETLRVLIEEGILVRDADSWSLRGASTAAEELHKSLAQRSESRLDGLGVSAWEIASILYLIEAPIEEDQLADLSDLRRERFRRTLDRLEGEGLVVRNVSGGVRTVGLAHESVREAVRNRYEDSLDETRLDLASRIEELDDPDASYVLLRARLLDDASEGLEAADALEQAAADLFEQGQPQLGAQVQERLIRRLRRHGRTQSLARLLRAELSLLENAAGAIEDPRHEIAHWEAGILVAELLGDYRAQAVFWLGLADRYTINAGDMGVGVARLENAAEAARLARDRVLELRIANRRAEILFSAGDIEKADQFSEIAMELVNLPDASIADKCHTIGVRLRCLSLAGRLDEARALHAQSRGVAEGCPVVQRQSYLSGVAFLGMLGGDPSLGIPEIEAAIEETRAIKLPRLLLTPLHNLGDLKLRSGDLDGAEHAFRETIRRSTLYGMETNLQLNRGYLGYVLALRGAIEEGAEMLADAKRELSRMKGQQVSLHQLRLLDAQVAHLNGHTARARRELEEMLADFQSSNQLSLAHLAQEALAQIERDLETSFIAAPLDPSQRTGDPEQDTVRTKPISKD